jgi:hypothetical protein
MTFWLEYTGDKRSRLGMFETLREAEVFGRQMQKLDHGLSDFQLGRGTDTTPGTGEVISTLTEHGEWKPCANQEKSEHH